MLDCTVAVDQKECIRRGIVTDSTVKHKINLDELNEFELEFIADRWKDGNLLDFGNPRQLLKVPAPDYDTFIKFVRQSGQAVEERRKRDEKNVKERGARAEAAQIQLEKEIEENPRKFIGIGNHFNFGTDYDAAVRRAARGNVPPEIRVYTMQNIPEHLRELLQQELEAVRKDIEDARQQLLLEKQEAKAAQLERLRPVFTLTQQEMFDRGYLDLDEVEKGIDARMEQELAAALGVGYRVTVAAREDHADTASESIFAILKHFEETSGYSGRIVGDKEVQLDATTPDGRKIHLNVEVVPVVPEEDAEVRHGA